MGLTSEDVRFTATLKEVKPGIFQLVSTESMLGFIGWDAEVLNLDLTARYGRVPSRHLSWHEVVIINDQVWASSVERAKQALGHVTVLFSS